MAEQFTLQMMIPAKTEQVFLTWLDIKLHTTITGGNYQVEPVAGGKFSAWDGYISGSFIDIEPSQRISMNWRASEFPEDAPDSKLTITFEGNKNETLVTLKHTNIPEGLGETYKQGWFDYYLDPLVEYYSK